MGKQLPKPVKTDSRICFAIEWYENESDADDMGEIARNAGEKYNGGYFHGMPCGRDSSFDQPGLYAVTRA